jgi:hypothetical protein
MQKSFAAGELSPNLYARVDLAKYQSGLAVCRNFFVDYRGGVSTRMGFRYIGSAGNSALQVRLCRFAFNTQQNYILEIGHRYIRFISQGAYILGADGNPYTLGTIYNSSDLFDLKFTQTNDTLTITHPGYPPCDLLRYGNTNWQLVPVTFVSKTQPPGSVTASPGVGGGSTYYHYVVTAIDATTGEESVQSPIGVASGCAVMSVNGLEHILVAWSPIANATLYNIYRRPEVPNFGPQAGDLFGQIGSSSGVTFDDRNLLPDFSKTPPLPRDPFANGTIINIVVSAGGSGYSSQTYVYVTDPTGFGFSGFPVIAGGTVSSIVIASGGANYTAPTVVIYDPLGGSGAATNTTVNPTGSGFVSTAPPSYAAPQTEGNGAGGSGDGTDGGGGVGGGGGAP